MPSAPKLPSNRSFGFLFAFVFALAGAWPLLYGGAGRPWAVLAGTFFLLAALIVPRALAPLNRAWMKLADILHHIVSPLVLGAIFFGVITPCAILMRLAGRDPLRLKRDRTAASYWIKRDPPGPDPRASMPRQF
ncbi:MAG: hypothetical protein GC131_06360 [Alphaproteobacteria bacterium]|nr:hypothetical protein [Alphaproteobacteria bacterium]